MARRPSDLQVDPARVSIHIQNLSREEKAADLFGFHAVGVYLSHLNAAGGDDGLRHRPGAGNGQPKILQPLQQRPALLRLQKRL